MKLEIMEFSNRPKKQEVEPFSGLFARVGAEGMPLAPTLLNS